MKALAILLTLAFVALDWRAYVLMRRADVEGLWILIHLMAIGMAAAAAWVLRTNREGE